MGLKFSYLGCRNYYSMLSFQLCSMWVISFLYGEVVVYNPWKFIPVNLLWFSFEDIKFIFFMTCRWWFCLYYVGTEKLLVTPISVFQKLIHTAEYHAPQVVILENWSLHSFNNANAFPLQNPKIWMLSACFSLVNCVLIITHDKGTSYEHEYWTQIFCQLVGVHITQESIMF